MDLIKILITFGSFLGVILGYAIMLFSEWYIERNKQIQYRKYLSRNSAFWDPLNWG